MGYYEKIPGERVYLSPIDRKAIPQYTKWVNDSYVSNRLGLSHKIVDEETEAVILEDLPKDGYSFAIVRREDNALLGNCGIKSVNHVYRHGECGLFIGESENRGKGYGSEALRLLLRYGFDTLNLNNIMLVVFEFNKNAVECYERIGFQLMGRRRKSCFVNGQYHDALFMDILPEDFFAGEKRRL